MELINTNLSICRVCLGKNVAFKSISTFETFSERTMQVKEVMTICASVQVEIDDGLSQEICTDCLRRLSEAYAFRILCETSDFTLRNNLEVTIKSEEEEEKPYDMEQVNITDTGDIIYECEEIIEKDNQEVVNFTENIELKNDFDNLFQEVKPADTSTSTTSKITTQLRASLYHGKLHSLKLYRCDICNLRYVAKQDFENHKKTHSLKKPPYVCGVCCECFDTLSMLNKHKQGHISNEATSNFHSKLDKNKQGHIISNAARSNFQSKLNKQKKQDDIVCNVARSNLVHQSISNNLGKVKPPSIKPNTRIKYRCVVPTCLNPYYYRNSISPETYKQKHFFQSTVPHIKNLWIERLKSTFPEMVLKKHFKICEDHFVESDFTSTLRTRIHVIAVPSIFNSPSSENLNK